MSFPTLPANKVERPKTVLIENPVQGGRKFIKWKQALQFVAEGRAFFTTSTRIRFNERDPRHLDRKELADLQLAWRYQDHVEHGTMATLDQVAGLPCIKPIEVLTKSTVRHIYSRFERVKPVEIKAKNGIVCVETALPVTDSATA